MHVTTVHKEVRFFQAFQGENQFFFVYCALSSSLGSSIWAYKCFNSLAITQEQVWVLLLGTIQANFNSKFYCLGASKEGECLFEKISAAAAISTRTSHVALVAKLFSKKRLVATTSTSKKKEV